MPSETAKRTNLSSTGTTTAGTNGGTGTTVSPSETSWNYLSVVSKSVSLNGSNLTNSYIIGIPVESFLGVTNSSGALTNFTNKSYCAVVDFTISGYDVQLRAVAVPVSYYDFSAQKTVRILRVDFNEVTSSSSACNKPLFALNPSGVLSSEASPAPSAINSSGVVFDVSTVCTSCASIFSSKKVRLFESQSLQLSQVLTTSIDVSGLSLSIDPSNNSNTNNPSCTNASCQGTGYSCCLDNQCVNEGSIRPAAYSLYPLELQIAQQQMMSNPLIYKNYPQLYYVCGSAVPTNPTTTSGSTTGGSTPDPLAQINADYACVQEIKTHTSNVPYNNEFLNTGFTFTGSACNTTSATDSNYFITVMQRLYTTCGCLQTGIVAMVNNCPAYDYRKDANNIVECYVQESTAVNPVTYKNVSVPARSAPHRYFNASGVEEKIGSATSDQEGNPAEVFEYVDENKLLYTDKPFSMKAILGNFSRTLDQAQPAQTVDVEVDQVYLLSTISGYYTPCPSCGKDSWFNNFTAFPSSSYGTGLQATGHTTTRDMWSTNTTGGNYEDTIFGRACWVPPTMLPFSQKAINSTTIDPTAIQTQRLNRLKTQAALFANGYQRDWYGFNKGAIIGSFDGVSWFAIGKGRIVRSTSKKLFIAINAPFADLASPTTSVVNVQTYDGLTQATQLDYDPSYHQSHTLQNEAGNCQYHHQCSVDSDCITKLGWEYMCADVNGQQTTWPKFDAYGNETGEAQTVSIEQILLQKRFGGSNSKRCVYRGMGSICHTDANTLTPVNDYNKRKLLSCAPNFYCSPLNSSNFNTKIARWASAWEEIPVARNHLFGREANILGRPRDYMSSETVGALGSPITDNIKASFDASTATKLGLCLPGKVLPTTATSSTLWNPYEQQKAPDSSKRTDFINQIGSCNSGLFALARHSSCPVIHTNGDYLQFTPLFASESQTSYSTKSTAQNSCGLESLDSPATLTSAVNTIQTYSPFKNIESKPLAEQTVVSPSFARDACLRRVGEVCNTDLDCSPNKLHASEVDLYPLHYFGNSAEQQFYQEYLVCGQGDPKPLQSETADFKAYDMQKNRCCREVGKDITTFTPYSPNSADGNNASATLSTTDTPETRGLTPLTPGMGNNPKDVSRYTRFATVTGYGTINSPAVTANDDRSISGVNGRGLLTSASNIITGASNQWKSISEANSDTCCGGGWIRKFSDGSTDWTQTDRLNLDVQNFRCLNYNTPLMNEDLSDSFNSGYYNSQAALTSGVQKEYSEFCIDPLGVSGGCSQVTILSSTTETGPILVTFPNVAPADTYPTWEAGFELNTRKPNFSTNPFFYYMPLSADGKTEINMTNYNDGAPTNRRNFNIFVPIYINDKAIARWMSESPWGTNPANPGYNPPNNIRVVNKDGASLPINDCKYTPSLPDFTDYTANETTTLAGQCNSDFNPVACCWKYNSTDRRLRVVLNQDYSGTFGNEALGLKLKILSVTGDSGFSSDPSFPSRTNTLRITKPGNDLFYLNRLGKFELSGIPQITYEPIMCNNNANQLVPGLFKSTIKNFRGDFELGANSFYSNLDPVTPSYSPFYAAQKNQYANYKALAVDPVFSDKDFKCCTPLGKNTKSASTCCSGYGVAAGAAGKFTCMLPVGADISVYFNRLVSNEGRGADQPGGGLVEADFNTKTGEPLITNAVNQKLSSLGAAYCAGGKTRQGGAFGGFKPEPLGPHSVAGQTIYSIVDSSNDSGNGSNAGQTVKTGYTAFTTGYRWNHHLYCSE